MNFYALLALFAFFSYLFLGYLVLLLDRKRPINQIFFLYSLAAAAYSFAEFGYLQAESYETAWIWIKFRSVWPFTFATALHFHLWLTKRVKWVRHPVRLLLIYLPAIFFACTDLLTDRVSGTPVEQYGLWGYSPPEDSLLPMISGIYGLIFMLIMISLVCEYYFRIRKQSSFLSSQIAIILMADILVLVIVVINTFLQQLPDFEYINVDSALLLLSNFFIAFAIWRYSLLRITPEIASEEIVSNMSEFVFLVNADGRIGAANAQALSLSGLSLEGLENNKISDIFPAEINIPFAHDSGKKELKHLYKKEVMVTQAGNKIPVAYSTTPISVGHRGEQGWAYIGSQYLDGIRWNRQLDQMADKVNQTNLSMHNLIDSIHHDLSNSSRILYLLSKTSQDEQIIQHIQQKSPESGQDEMLDEVLQHLIRNQKHQQLMQEEAELLWKRMKGLKALLTAEQEVVRELVDLEQLAYSVCEQQRMECPNTEVKLFVSPLPSIEAAPNQFRQLFQQLFSNSIKFRSEHPLRISIELLYQDLEKSIFRFRDNGIGIEAQYHQRVFGVFQQLHPQNQYPGIGMGLPICKKIIESHGGEIWIESEVTEGTSICMSLPAVTYIYEESGI
ncbi:MAG: ATP-binding protein [Bacteroidota bacterium]